VNIDAEFVPVIAGAEDGDAMPELLQRDTRLRRRSRLFVASGKLEAVPVNFDAEFAPIIAGAENGDAMLELLPRDIPRHLA